MIGGGQINKQNTLKGKVFKTKDLERPPLQSTVSPISSANEESEGDKLNTFKDYLAEKLGGKGSQISTGSIKMQLVEAEKLQLEQSEFQNSSSVSDEEEMSGIN